MSYAGYEDIVDSMSGQKPKDDNINFDVGSFDANSSSINQTFQSVKKEDDLIKASHRFSLNNIMITDKKISESQEFKIENNTKSNMNNQSKDGKISEITETEKDILNENEKETIKNNKEIDIIKKVKKIDIIKKEKEKNPSSSLNKSSNSNSKRNSFIITRPIIKKISELKIDFEKIKNNLTQKKIIEDLEKILSDLKEENQKLIEQGDIDFQNKV